MTQTLEPIVKSELGEDHKKGASRIVVKDHHGRGPNVEAKLHPRLGCAGLIRRGDQLLLGRRNKEPNRGLWVLPGGGVEFCETFEQTLGRELLEEAGIRIT